MSKRLEKLFRPCDRLDKYDNEPYTKNPLLHIRLSEIRQRRHYSYLQKKAMEEKIKSCRRPLAITREDEEDSIERPQEYYIRKLRMYASRAPIPKMLKRTEKKILNFAPKRLRTKYPEIVNNYMKDVHADFDKIIRAYSLQKIMKPGPDDYIPPRFDFKFKRSGRTTNYNHYVKNRDKLKRMLMIAHPFIRCIVNYSNTDFPKHLCELEKYRVVDGEINIYDLKDQIKRDLRANSAFLQKTWYPKILKIIHKHYRKRTIQLKQWERALNCAGGLINRQLNEMKMRTIDHMNEVILDRERMPFIKTIAIMEGGLVLVPGLNETITIFQEFIDDILAVGDHLDPITYSFEETARATMRGVLWKITIGDIYRQDALHRIKLSLTRAYDCMTNYLATFQNEYYKLYSPVTEAKLDSFLTEPHTFDERLVKIEEFQMYVDKIKRLVAREYFDIVIVNQSEAIKALRGIAQSLVDRVVDKLVDAHRLENIEICKEFEIIRNKALAIPKSTEHLVENGEYMKYVKETYTEILGDRIQKSMQIMGILVELRELSQEHLQLQIRTVNWMHNIQTAFDTNTQNYDMYKFQFEEKLQEVIRTLSDKIDELIPHLQVINDMCEVEKLSDYHAILENFLEQIVILDDYVTWTNKEELLFKFPKSQYPTLDSIKAFVVPFMLLIKLCMRWLRCYYVWMDGPFEYLEPEVVSKKTDEFHREFQKTQKYYRGQIKVDQLKDAPLKFKGQMEDPDPDKHPVPLKLCTKMTNWIKEFRMGVYVVNIMCNLALRDRHWDEMSDIAGFDVAPNAGTTLRKILNFKIEHILDKFEIISISANKELQLQKNLAAMMHEWETIKFTTSYYKDTDIVVLTSLDDIQCILDDHIVKTLTMRGSAFVKPCEEEVKMWYAKLTRINKTLSQWGRVQATWLYLLPIFSSSDIVAQMPEEGKLFVKVDLIYKRYMQIVSEQPLVGETAATAGLLEEMQSANNMLEDIMNGVNAYLEKKRLFFPRFFFLSNDEMLEILSETKDPLRVQPHLSKCFEGINRLKFDEELIIQSMMSVENEEVRFLNEISTEEARGSVEKWLLRVQEEMSAAIKQQIIQSYSAYFKKARSQWVLDWPGMIILCVSQIFWAAEMHSCFLFKNPKLILNFFEQVQEDLNEIVTLIRSKEITNLHRITIKALIVIDVHAKDVVDELIRMKVNSEQDFRWLAQLRYYFEGGNVVVKIINAAVRFAYEYLGNTDRLVITPLTDRCYRTLMGAYQLHLNGAPEGPAGTGKTETTKDLAKALAIQCKVFNCSDGLDYKAMGKFFKGLASCGAWACFDEFNRIELEVLSVVAQQILTIIQAVRAKMKKFQFEGTEIELNPACYVCITMNPGYAGRSELPDNLKVLFRTVAMMIPDYAMIGEISLYSFGFVNARSLSVKIVTTYRLCSEQLSSQNHYDYGMRAVKTVLQACGNLKKCYPDENEEILLLRSLIDVNLPKFLSFDVPLFNGIISDLFPGVSLPNADYGLLTDTFNTVCKDMCLQPLESFLRKMIQTFEMMIVRHGFMMVGEPYAGKSAILKVLAKCMELLQSKGINPYFQRVEIGVVNPKSVTLGHLYGAFDPVSYEWTDGIASKIFRSFAVDTSPHRKWLIFDGPVDAIWIENMNTVLDDNKKLCLTSGEVITMNPSMSMIFEVMDLSQASPATVSRCGMIYMEPVTLGWEAFAMTWCDRQNPAWIDGWKDYVMDMLRWIVPQSLMFVRKNCLQLLYPGETKLLMTTLSIVEMFMRDACEENSEDFSRYIFGWYQSALLIGVVWGIGGILDNDSRIKFDDFYRELWKGTDESNPYPDKHGKIDAQIPPEGLVFDYYYVFKQKGIWKYWPDYVRTLKPETGISVQIPTIDTARYMYMLDLHIKHKVPMLLVGPTGTGKSFYIQNYMIHLNPDEFIPTFITFTTQITAEQTQELVITKLHKRKRGLYGPPKGKHCVLFIDDLNMPAKEVYGAQPPIELIRQYFDHRTWYDVTDATPIHISDILIIAACGLVGGSRQDVYPRFLCHFNIFSINNFSDETMHRIFSAVLLDGYKKSGHSTDVITNCNQIVNATLETYKFACENLRPTPAKSHYVFNLRDVSRVVMGCALLKKESVESKKIFSRIWFHEIMRVFFDRLINDEDRGLVFNKLTDCIRDVFKDKAEDLFDNYLNERGAIDREKLNNLYFGSYFHMDIDAEERKYEEIIDLRAFRELAYKSLEEYNATTRMKMNIVLFQYALMHLNRICRIMSIPGASALLVGVGGSGRQSLTRLAANICNQQFFQPDITKSYGMNEWRDDLKRILRTAGGLGRDTVFLFNESQIKLEGFLQDIDCLLNLGEVPNIFPVDEKQEILELVRLAAQGGNRNLDISPLQVFQFFINRCKQKLHIVLCFSPIGSGFRTWTRLYPSLVNCCTIDWYEQWPENSLEMVAERYMQALEVPLDVKKSVIRLCKEFHVEAISIKEELLSNTGRIIYVTSASYLELIKSYNKLIKQKQEETMASKMRYIVGLEKLQDATEAVAAMQKELNELQPTLMVMAENSRKMTEQIERESIEAAAATEQVKKDEIVANIQAAEAQALKADCEADLAVAIPILEDAIEALNTLKPADITLVKSMKNPPSAIKLVMAAVVVMKGIPPDRINDAATGRKILDYWGPSKRILGDMAFLQTLKEFDKDNINPDIMKRIRKEFIPHPDFRPEVVAKASSAAEGLCKWVIAMDKYDKIAKEVAPKKLKLEVAEQEYADTMRILNEKRSLALALEARVRELNVNLAEANIKKKKVEDEVEACKNKLIRAETLISGLGGEKARWINAAESLQKDYENLAGDILLSCGVIAYLAPLTSFYRNKALESWYNKCQKSKIPCSENFSLVSVLGSDITTQHWNICGLPRDIFSTENAIIMQNSERYSLFIDPQGQANKWIKTMERNNQLRVLKFSQSDYMKRLEQCIEFGYPALIENIFEDIDVALDTLLAKNTFQIGGHESISLGDNVIPMSSKFKLYFTTNLRNPHYLPEIFNKVTIVNFALTLQGLEDQLLGIVVAKERPDLQELRQSLIIESAKNKATLKNVEDNILKTLSESKGDILEDETAIKMLDDSKLLSQEIKARQEESKITEEKIESFRLSYKPVASHSSVLYYCITDLPNIDPMYQFSLAWFINLYIYSIEHANKSKDLHKRLKFLMDAITFNLYSNVCRSLFEKDKLLFSFVLTSKVMLASNQIDASEFQFLISGGEQREVIVANPAPDWITEKMWDDINRLEQLSVFTGFVNNFVGNLASWKIYFDYSDPQLEIIPSPWNESTNSFEKMIILHAVRPDKVAAAVTLFVTKELGAMYVMPPQFDISKSYEDSNCLTPLIFILSPGADPMSSLLLFAERMGFEETFQSISLGQGQGPIAQAMIEKAQKDGTWVCLQNCHLAESWMPILEYIWENMEITNTEASFRLWLTSYPWDKFPTAILQNGIKMTNEPPTGLRQNLLRSYTSEPMSDEKFYTGCPGKDRAFTKLLYGICFFHAVVQERRNFGALGWNIPYGFNESDFQISVQQLQIFLNSYEEVPYMAISYLTGECNYGGRVTDSWDRRLICTILDAYINEKIVNDSNYKFSTDISFGIPRKTEWREVVKFIEENVPITPTPNIYGLHQNAGIMRDLNYSNNLLESMMLTQGKQSVGIDADAEKNLLITMMDIEKRLPELTDLETVKEKYPVDYNESMNTVLVQEMERFNFLLAELKSTCSDVQKAIKGLVVMTPDLEETCTSIIFKKIPNRWMKKSYPSLKPVASYIQDLLERLRFLQEWNESGKPATFWISGFYFTQAFLTGAMQNYARHQQIPIDTLTFDFLVKKVPNTKQSPENGVYVYGLFVDGARWLIEPGVLDEQMPKVLLDVMPLIHFKPVLLHELNEDGRYKCPIYKTLERKGVLSTTGHSTNYVLPILLATQHPVTHWIKRSVALICQTSD